VPRLLVDVSPLRHNRDFRLLYSGQVVSLLGSNLTVVAVPFQVYSQTHSNLWVGLASLIQLPFLITGALWGGAMGDRADKRVLMLLSSVVLGLTSAGLALNAGFHDHHLIFLLLLAALSAGFAGFSSPLRTAAIPKLVKPEELVASYSLNQVAVNSAAVIGPALAGVFIASIGLFSCYAVDAITFALLTLLTSFMSAMPATGEHTGTRMLRAIGDGFRYVRSHAVVQAVYLVDLNAMVFGLPRALFPAVVTGWIARVQRQGRLVAMVVMAWGAAITIFGLVHIFWIGLACLGVAGAMDVISTVLRNTILQNAITDEFRSRISSIQMAVVTGGPRLGDVESGVLANYSSTEFSIVSGGIACIVGVLVLMKWRPTFWEQGKL